MSCCKIRNKNDCCCEDDRDYWFRLGRSCCSGFRDNWCRPAFPRVIQGTVIIPQTSIPVQIVLGTGGGFGTTGGASLLQSISLTPQTLGTGAAIPFGTNFGNGVFTGF